MLLFNAGVVTERPVHGHGGAMNEREGISFGTWQFRFEERLADLKYLSKVGCCCSTRAW